MYIILLANYPIDRKHHHYCVMIFVKIVYTFVFAIKNLLNLTICTHTYDYKESFYCRCVFYLHVCYYKPESEHNDPWKEAFFKSIINKMHICACVTCGYNCCIEIHTGEMMEKCSNTFVLLWTLWISICKICFLGTFFFLSLIWVWLCVFSTDVVENSLLV